MDSGYKWKRPPNPRLNANIFEILSFSWMFNLFKIGREKDLDVNDIYTTLPDHKSSILGDELERKWRREVIIANKMHRNPSLLRILIEMFGFKFMLHGVLIFIGDIVLKMSQPLFIGGLLTFFNPDDTTDKTDLRHAYIYSSCLMLSMLASMLLYHSTQIEMLHFGMKIRVACCSAIFKKALRLSKTALGETTFGQVVNLLSNDVNRFDNAVFYLHFLWISPLQIVVATYFIWQEVGVSSVFGLVACVMFIPLQGWLAKKTSEYRLQTAVETDERVRLMNEIISGIQVIKMYTWEKPIALLAEYARKNEIDPIRKSSYVRATLNSFVSFHTKIALFFCIYAYVLMGNYITARKIFVITSYYNLFQTTLTTRFPQGIALLAEMLVSIKRLQNFIMYEEKNDTTINFSKTADKETAANVTRKLILNNENFINNNGKNHNDTTQFGNSGIAISDASAKWTDAQTENTLERINLTVVPGRLVAIIGPVGAGKSSLMHAILRELPIFEGSISVHGTVSYASQEPWLFGGSVKKNILFGSPMDRERYREVVNVCALKLDFEQLPYGDRTIIGERGVSLSGGQRARINLARAVYKRADIYLLDDPLSAVDTHVGRHLFDKCIKGFLKDKTCVLITHQLQYLTSIDHIVLMDNANVLAEGTYQELQTANLDFTKLLQSSVDEVENETFTRNDNNLLDVDQMSAFNRRSSVRRTGSSTVDDRKFSQSQADPTEVAETRSFGSISNKVYWSYVCAGGSKWKILFFILVCIVFQIVSSGGDLWITYWINLEERIFRNAKIASADNNGTAPVATAMVDTLMGWPVSRQTCVNVFALITMTVILITAIKSIMFVSVCMKASMNLHNKMFYAIIRATMYFFNTNSSGRILNRFSKDMGVIDEILPITLMDTLKVALTIMGIIIVVGMINMYLMIPTFIVVYISYNISTFYMSTSRSIKRLEGITRSPIFSHLNATLQGLTTIRAFKAEQILSEEFDNHQDLHSSVWYLFITSNRALGVWLDVICIIYVTIVTFSFIIIKNDISGGNVGLAITQALGIVGSLQWGMRQITEMENQMTSVERVLEYTNVPQEGALESSSDKKPPTNWPSKGKITFKNFYLRYNPEMPYVIKDLSVNIESMQKVGIVGRTGAGKTSLIAGLFRLALNEGQIIIDDKEIHEMGLHDLRSTISIIPQEPVLFSGTLRKNLDPIDEYPDHILWNALDEVELKDIVEDLPDGLNSTMSEGGSNFSVGQRQLVCLARAIVRKNKILVLDEATANVDPQTDILIQSSIRDKFRTCTVLTIAHRLNTVMDSDKVLVMDAGKMVEFDHPYNLLKNEDGFLYKMVEQTGKASADLLHSIAEESYNTRNKTTENSAKSVTESVEDLSKKTL